MGERQKLGYRTSRFLFILNLQTKKLLAFDDRTGMETSGVYIDWYGIRKPIEGFQDDLRRAEEAFAEAIRKQTRPEREE